MTSVVVEDQLNFSCDEGSSRSLIFMLQESSGSPTDLTGLTLEFCAESMYNLQVVKILTTDVGNTSGSLVIGTPATGGQLTLTLTPIATAAMYNNTGYVYWSIWASPGTGSASTVVNGRVSVRRVAQS